MISVKIKQANMALGQPDDWDAEEEECARLFVRKETRGNLPVMLSAWKPSASELEALILGGSLILGVIGNSHPPVLMYVSPED